VAPQETDAPVARLYFENSKINEATAGRLAERVGRFNVDLGLLRQSTSNEKTYPGASTVPLPTGRRVPRLPMRLDEALAARRSARCYLPRPVELADLNALLLRGGGITGELHHPQRRELKQCVRAAPSGGALYPIETYLVGFNVRGLPKGAYHVHQRDCCLEEVVAGDLRDAVNACIISEQAGLNAPCLLVMSARWGLPFKKYGERGLRIALLDAGHLAQNYLLCATALGLAACPVAGFYDDALARLLKLDPALEPVVYVVTLGYAGA
jgi:SagB-type dehydrogenase family enzyme